MNDGIHKQKVMVIGIDGATFDIIKPMMSEGQLPNIERLIAQGVHGNLRSTIQPSSEQAWSSFMTGQNNGKHGIFGFIQRKPGTYDFEMVNGSLRQGKSIWRIMSDHGKKVIVINVPMTFPPETGPV